MRARRVGLALLVCLCGLRSAAAQSPENVAVVINENSAASQVIAEHYVKKRAIPEANIIRIHAPTDEIIDRPTYLTAIEQPIAAALKHAGLQDRILYIVLTKGVPLRVNGTLGLEGTMASVDSELTLLYRKMLGQPVPAPGRIANPYFLGDRDVADAQRFSHRGHDIYLVTRLDAFTVEEAQMLVDAAVAPSMSGQIVLDQRDALVARIGEEWLARAAKTVSAIDAPDRVVLETTTKPANVSGPVLGYFSWGSTDPQLHGRYVGMQFAPGALAATFAGIDARTFEAPPPTWTPMKNPNDPSTWFGGGPQSLIGDLIREGVTGAAGNVGEPLLEGVVRPYVVFPAYLRGLNLAEAFYLATPFLSWETVIVGDPLCQPFARKPLPRTDAIPPIDRSTDMPQFFSERRLRLASAAPGAATIAPLLVRAEARLDRGDRAGARAVLIEATTMAPDSVIAHLQLAVFEDGSDDRKAAIAAYRRVLELQPQNIIALNNLAYDLAAYANSPEEARPLAVRAVALSKRASGVVDTLGWIEHLSGNDAAAAPLIAEALRGAQSDADIQFHAAVLAAGAGDHTSAAAHLREALKRDPTFERRADVIALRDQLAAAVPPATDKRRP